MCEVCGGSKNSNSSFLPSRSTFKSFRKAINSKEKLQQLLHSDVTGNPILILMRV